MFPCPLTWCAYNDGSVDIAKHTGAMKGTGQCDNDEMGGAKVLLGMSRGGGGEELGFQKIL